MPNLNELDDLTTTDSDMPSPEVATMTRSDFEAGRDPKFKSVDTVTEDTTENEDIKAFYEWHTMEKYSAYLYRYLSAKANLLGLTGAESFFIRKYEEETEHANTVLEYILMRFDHDEPLFYSIDEPPQLGHGEDIIGTFIAMFQVSLEHERKVTAQITDLKENAEWKANYQDSAFIDIFLKEQVEEEDEFRTIIQRATLAGEEGSILSLEHELFGSIEMKDPD